MAWARNRSIASSLDVVDIALRTFIYLFCLGNSSEDAKCMAVVETAQVNARTQLLPCTESTPISFDAAFILGDASHKASARKSADAVRAFTVKRLSTAAETAQPDAARVLQAVAKQPVAPLAAIVRDRRNTGVYVDLGCDDEYYTALETGAASRGALGDRTLLFTPLLCPLLQPKNDAAWNRVLRALTVHREHFRCCQNKLLGLSQEAKSLVPFPVKGLLIDGEDACDYVHPCSTERMQAHTTRHMAALDLHVRAVRGTRYKPWTEARNDVGVQLCKHLQTMRDVDAIVGANLLIMTIIYDRHVQGRAQAAQTVTNTHDLLDHILKMVAMSALHRSLQVHAMLPVVSNGYTEKPLLEGRIARARKDPNLAALMAKFDVESRLDVTSERYAELGRMSTPLLPDVSMVMARLRMISSTFAKNELLRSHFRARAHVLTMVPRLYFPSADAGEAMRAARIVGHELEHAVGDVLHAVPFEGPPMNPAEVVSQESYGCVRVADCTRQSWLQMSQTVDTLYQANLATVTTQHNRPGLDNEWEQKPFPASAGCTSRVTINNACKPSPSNCEGRQAFHRVQSRTIVNFPTTMFAAGAWQPPTDTARRRRSFMTPDDVAALGRHMNDHDFRLPFADTLAQEHLYHVGGVSNVLSAYIESVSSREECIEALRQTSSLVTDIDFPYDVFWYVVERDGVLSDKEAAHVVAHDMPAYIARAFRDDNWTGLRVSNVNWRTSQRRAEGLIGDDKDPFSLKSWRKARSQLHVPHKLRAAFDIADQMRLAFSMRHLTLLFVGLMQRAIPALERATVEAHIVACTPVGGEERRYTLDACACNGFRAPLDKSKYNLFVRSGPRTFALDRFSHHIPIHNRRFKIDTTSNSVCTLFAGRWRKRRRVGEQPLSLLRRNDGKVDDDEADDDEADDDDADDDDADGREHRAMRQHQCGLLRMRLRVKWSGGEPTSAPQDEAFSLPFLSETRS